MSKFIEFATKELDLVLNQYEKGSVDYEKQKVLNETILNLVKVYEEYKYEGYSKTLIINTVNRLFKYKPLTPLTGEEDEWEEEDTKLETAGTVINKRCPTVVKTVNGEAFDLESKIYSSDGGNTWYFDYNTEESISFPYYVPDEPQSIILNNDNKEETVTGD